jgi:hypothetical protein
LASSLNVELVHIILKGIKKFTNIPIDNINTSFSDKEDDSFEVMRICRLNRIKIKDPKKWDTAKYEEYV